MANKINSLTAKIRPSNMRGCHGLRTIGEDGRTLNKNLSVPSAFCTDEFLDPHGYAFSGFGMDAPDMLDAGSVKAFFTRTGKNENDLRCFGFCQCEASRGD